MGFSGEGTALLGEDKVSVSIVARIAFLQKLYMALTLHLAIIFLAGIAFDEFLTPLKMFRTPIAGAGLLGLCLLSLGLMSHYRDNLRGSNTKIYCALAWLTLTQALLAASLRGMLNAPAPLLVVGITFFTVFSSWAYMRVALAFFRGNEPYAVAFIAIATGIFMVVIFVPLAADASFPAFGLRCAVAAVSGLISMYYIFDTKQIIEGKDDIEANEAVYATLLVHCNAMQFGTQYGALKGMVCNSAPPEDVESKETPAEKKQIRDEGTDREADMVAALQRGRAKRKKGLSRGARRARMINEQQGEEGPQAV